MDTLLISVGAIVGANARYWVGVLFSHLLPLAVISWGTLVINITGSFALGLFLGWDSIHHDTGQWRLLVATGFCGAYTTFSTFSAETFTLMRSGDHLVALGYVVLSVVAGLTAAAGAYTLGRLI